jgi:predicted 3-demethylubiquinone-9 3-methyltransferase (glyoxalase superfamily)
MNGGPIFKFEAISFQIFCETQADIDSGKLTENGEEGQCGWLKEDKYRLFV